MKTVVYSAALAAWICTLFAVSGTARADQCAWIAQTEADTALEYLRPGKTILDYCEPCDSKARKIKIDKVQKRPVADSKTHFEIFINGDPIDLAYIFIQRGTNEYHNLAKIVKCPASGVSRIVTWPPQQSAVNWSGKYVKGVSFVSMSNGGRGPSYSIQVNLEHPQFNNRYAEIVGSGDLDNNRIIMQTIFPGCTFTISKPDNEKLKLSTSGCGTVGNEVTGIYKQKMIGHQ